jgi:hypothetical protein
MLLSELYQDERSLVKEEPYSGSWWTILKGAESLGATLVSDLILALA